MSDLRSEVLAVVDRYGTALDRRDWALLERVFVEDLIFDAGEWVMRDRASYIHTVRGYLEGCGPTQHLLGNYRVEFESDDEATSACYVRAFHLDAEQGAALTYEMGGEYRDRLRRTPDGWRITHRTLEVLYEVGSREVLRRGPKAG
jgi:3-phenylpropionate/cinnamic acid dioxygenase small subunit